MQFIFNAKINNVVNVMATILHQIELVETARTCSSLCAAPDGNINDQRSIDLQLISHRLTTCRNIVRAL